MASNQHKEEQLESCATSMHNGRAWLRNNSAFIATLVILSAFGVLVSYAILRSGKAAPAGNSQNAASNGLSQQGIELLAAQYIQSKSLGSISRTNSRKVTLGQLVGAHPCSEPESLVRWIAIHLGSGVYNPCDPSTLLWLVQLRGEFQTTSGKTTYWDIVFLEDGTFFRADGGPLTP